MNWMITGKCNYNCLHCFNASDNSPLVSEFTLSEASAKQTGKGLAPSLHASNEIVGKTYHFIKGYTLSIVGDGEAVFVIL